MKHISCGLCAMALALALLAQGYAYACSCAYMGKFIDYISDGKGVIRARIKSYGPRLTHGKGLYESMVVEIVEVVRGTYSAQELTLLGDPGNLCRAYVDSERFKTGSEHFISIIGEKTTQPLGGCGESSVIIRGNKIEGNEYIEGEYKAYTMEVGQFRELIKAQ